MYRVYFATGPASNRGNNPQITDAHQIFPPHINFFIIFTYPDLGMIIAYNLTNLNIMEKKTHVGGATDTGKADTKKAADAQTEETPKPVVVDPAHKDTAADIGLSGGVIDQKTAKLNEIKDAQKVATSEDKADGDGEKEHYKHVTDPLKLRKMQQNYVAGSKEHGEIADRIHKVSNGERAE